MTISATICICTALILGGMKQQDLHQLVKYSDKYVAFVGNIRHVKAVGTSMSEVYQKLKEKKITDATITYIPPVDKSVAFASSSSSRFS
jgi:hypothetical protein